MPLVIEKRVDAEHLKIANALIEEALNAAIQAAMQRIRLLAQTYTPVKTGKLLRSFDVAITGTGKTIALKWSAQDPVYGYDYAQVVEYGRTGGKQLLPKTKKAMKFEWPYGSGQIRFSKGPLTQGAMQGRYYGESVANEAILILEEELAIALLAQEWT